MQHPRFQLEAGVFLRLRSLFGKGLWDVADACDIVHIYIVELGKLYQAFYRDTHFAFFIVGVSRLRNVYRVGNVGLIQVVVVAERFDTFNVQHRNHLFVESLQRMERTS